MRYRLGQFGQSSALISQASLDEFLARWRQAGTSPERIEQMRKLIVGEELPELRTELASETERRWLDALHDRMVDLLDTIEIRFLECCYRPGSDGFLCVTATSPSVRAEVRPGDFIQAGFIALRRSDRPIRLSSRVFRLTCSNGSVEKLLEEDAGVIEVENIRTALGRCFDPQVLADVAGGFREGRFGAHPPGKSGWSSRIG